MSAETITPFDLNPSNATVSDSSGGGAGRGGSENSPGSPLVVVQQPRSVAPPRPAPRQSQGNTDNSLRNGYAAISHSVSGETAAIGLGFILGGPIGAIIGGTLAPAALAAMMWRSRNAEHDANSNDTGTGNGASGRSGSGSGGTGGTGNRGRGNGGGGRNHGSGGRRHHTPNRAGSGASGGAHPHRKPKTKDPVLDKLSKGLGKLKPHKGGSNLKGPKNKASGGSDKAGKGPKSWKGGGDATSTSAPDGLSPRDKKPKRDRRSKNDKNSKSHKRGRAGAGDVTGQSVPDGLPPGPAGDRLALVRAKREKQRRREAIAAGQKAADKAARDQNLGDPHKVKLEVIRQANQTIDLELHHENQLLALTAAAETPRSTPVNYPAIQAAPTGTRTAGAAIARQIDFRGSTAFAILRAMADQLAHGLHSDADADMADHIVELTGIPNMCKNLSLAVQEAGQALSRTAPLHPSVIKHLNNAAVAARTAGVMAENIMVVFVQAHREDIIRVLDPRIGEERWNIRNARGTLDAAKLRTAIASAHTARLALPGGTSGGASGGQGGSKLVPASDGSTKKLIDLMKGFKRGHMVVVLSEVAGSAAGVDAVADAIDKLYRRMQKTWPTENVVDDTVARTAGQVRRVASELQKAIKAAEKAHQRELRLNAKGRAGKGALAEKKWDVVGRRGAAN